MPILERLEAFPYYYNTADENGNLVVKCQMLSRDEHIRITGLDPVAVITRHWLDTEYVDA